MNTLLISLNSKYIHASLAIWYLKKGIDTYTNDIKAYIYESTINKDINLSFNEIIKYNTNILCFSTYIWNISYTLRLIDMLKEYNPNYIIILGGPEASYNPINLINNKNIDYIIKGEGEEALSALLTCLKNDDHDYSNISGLVTFNNGELVNNKVLYVKQFLNPYTDEFMNQIKGRIVYIETTRGCPFNCAFCLSGVKDKTRFFNLDESLANIAKLSNSGTKTIKFVDRTFNCNLHRANEILKYIVYNPDHNVNQNVTFHFEIAGDILNDEFINILKDAKKGLIQFEIGLQTFNHETLLEVHRYTRIDLLVNNIKKLLAINRQHIHIDLIAGLPKEGLESFKDSFDLAYELKPHMLQLGFLKLIHGSYLKEHFDEYFLDYDHNPPYQVKETKWLKEEELEIITHVEDVLERMYNSSRFLLTLDYLLEHLHKKPFELMEFIYEKVHVGMDKFISYDDYSDLIYNNLKDYCDDRFKDVLIIDRLKSNKQGRLNKAIKEYNPNLKKYRIILDSKIKEEKGIKRALELINNNKTIIYVDYKDMDVISKRYEEHYIEVEDLLKEDINDH